MRGTIDTGDGVLLDGNQRPGARIYGGFAGTETRLSQRDPSLNPTIWEGSGTRHLLNASGANVLVDGMSLTTATTALIASTLYRNTAEAKMQMARENIEKIMIKLTVDGRVESVVRRGGDGGAVPSGARVPAEAWCAHDVEQYRYAFSGPGGLLPRGTAWRWRGPLGRL